MSSDLPEHAQRNREHWDAWAPEYAKRVASGWTRAEPTWGIWGVPESELRLLPDDLAGKDAIELGCGTAYVSAWLARRGARVVGIDNSAKQLETARALQREHGLEFPLVHGNAETVPYPDASFDFALCAVSIQYLTRPVAVFAELARVLRPGGRAVIATSHRCFPTKAIRAWHTLPPTARRDAISRYFAEAKGYAPAEHLDRSPEGADPLWIVTALRE